MILTTARPSKRYRNYQSIADLILQARLVNGRVVYYETHLGDAEWTIRIKEKTAQAMFPVGRSIKNQPFRAQENKDFYTVLNRHRKRYQQSYKQLINGITYPVKLKRTKPKHTKLKRTKPKKQLKNTQDQFQDKMNTIIADLIKGTGYNIDGVYGFITDTQRGRSYPDGRFSVPMWAYKDKRKGYFIYYTAHELSHQISDKLYGKRKSKMHDDKFYKVFTRICPKAYQHHELNYKKTAAKYGIVKKGE